MGAAEPSPDVHDERDESQYDDEMDQRHKRYIRRMVVCPFEPSQQRRDHNREDEFPCRPQSFPKSLARSPSCVPDQIVKNPARDSPMKRSGHARSVAPLCGIDENQRELYAPGTESVPVAG